MTTRVSKKYFNPFEVVALLYPIIISVTSFGFDIRNELRTVKIKFLTIIAQKLYVHILQYVILNFKTKVVTQNFSM